MEQRTSGKPTWAVSISLVIAGIPTVRITGNDTDGPSRLCTLVCPKQKLQRHQYRGSPHHQPIKLPMSRGPKVQMVKEI